MSNDIPSRVEALLFVDGGSLPLRKLAHLLDIKDPALQEGLQELSRRLAGTGLTLIVTDTEATLAVASDTSQTVKKIYERELSREIGDAGLEVLAIILYRGPSTRAQIDYIRGVNTSSTIRTLMSRGLIERTGNPDDAREYFYRPTSNLLAHIGVENATAIPAYATIKAELSAFEESREKSLEHDHGDVT